MKSNLDIVKQLLGHRLQQSDIVKILDTLGANDREELMDKIAGILSKVSALLEVSNRLSDSLSVSVLLERMMEITKEALGSERASLFLNDEENNELYSQIPRLEKEIRFPNHLGIAGTVFTNGKHLIINDAYSDERFNPEIDRKTGYRTRNILCAPIRMKNQKVIGVTQLLNKKDGDFSEDDITLLEAISSQASSALQNAHLHEQVQKARAEEVQLLEITTAISSELKLPVLLKKIMKTVTEILDCDRSTLFLYDEATKELWSQVAQGVGSQEIRFPCHLGIAGSVFTTGETINIPDAYKDQRFNTEVDKKTGYHTKSILCMPVINKKGQYIGVTQVLNKNGGPFVGKDEKRLRAFSAQAAIAIENAQLFEDVINIKNYNESILESLRSGVMTMDANHRIVKCNQAALSLLGVQESDVLQKNLSEFFGAKNSWISESVQRVFETHEADFSMDMEIILPHKTTVLSVNLHVMPLKATSGELAGLLFVFDDISSEKRLRGTLSRYMTKKVAEQLLEEPQNMLGGKIQVASVLFSDIRKFTSISEKMGAQETVLMLNDYFTRMVDIIDERDGILDKFIGDAILAVFGIPFSGEADSENSVNAAIGMLRSLLEFNQERMQAGKEAIEIGIGVNTAEVLVGNIGSLKRMDYTVIGDGVNLASRLEGANKFYGTSLLISDFTFHKIRQEHYHFREIDLIQVKGKQEPVRVYEILDYLPDLEATKAKEVTEIHHAALSYYRGQDWGKAIEKFEEIRKLSPSTLLAKVYLERCHYFQSNSPGKDWQGVWTMTSK